MSAAAALRALAAGQRIDDALLPPVRLLSGGAEYFGEEAVLHAFRRAPLILSDTAETIETEGHLALFDGETALFAWLYGQRIARIWRLGAGAPGRGEPMIGVPFDTDLQQARRDVAFRPDDHPALAPEAAGAVETIGRDLAHGWDASGDGAGPYRIRPFVIQAFSQGGRGAVLFAAHQLGGDIVRSSGFTFIGASFGLAAGGVGDCHIVRDRAGEAEIEQRAWRTRFA